jgi:HEAT repeat protein/ATP/ADP translocase
MHLLSKLLNIRRGEWPRFLMLYAMAFIFIAGITWGELVAQASFLFRSGINNLPQVLIANAIISIIAIMIYTPFVDRVANDKLLIGISLISAAAIGVGYAMLGTLPLVAYPLLYLLSLVIRQTFNIQWWTYVNDFYDTRAAKRIIPALTTASRIAIIFAGLTIPVFRRLPSGSVALIWLGSLLVVAAMAWLMPHIIKQETVTEEAPRGKAQASSFLRDIREGYQYVSRSPFMRWTALSSLVTALLAALLTYLTSHVFVEPQSYGLQQTFESDTALSSFLGSLNSWSSLILLPIQLFLLSRIVGRIGLGNSYLVFRLVTLGISGALIAVPTVGTSALSYIDQTALNRVFRSPTENMLYNAVPQRVKGRARAFITGFITPIGSLIGGLLLLLTPYIQASWYLRATIAVSLVAFILSALFVRREYAHALISMLEQEDFSFLLSSATDLDVTDAATFRWLTQKLEESTSDDFKIFIAKLISEIGGVNAVPILERLAREASSDIRATIVDILVATDTRGEAVGKLYADLLADPDPRVRRSAIAALEHWAGPQSEQYLALALEMLRDPDIEVRAQVIPSLIASGDFFYLASAVQLLTSLLADPDPAQRARGVRVLGQVGDVRFVRNLAEYLNDADGQVRVEAITAIETLAQKMLPDPLAGLAVKAIRNLRYDPIEGVRHSVLEIARRIDSAEARYLLVEFLSDPSPRIREEAVQALAAIGKDALPLLNPLIQSGNPWLHKMASVTLAHINPDEFRSLVMAHIHNDLYVIYKNRGYLEALSDCAGYAGIFALKETLQEENQRLTEEIFYLLAALYDKEAVDLIAESLRSENQRVRANAVEALESLTTPQTANLIAPLFEPTTQPSVLLQIGEQQWGLQHPNSRRAIAEFAAHPQNPWLRAIAIHALGEMGAALKAQEQPAPAPAEKRRTPRIRPVDLLGALTGEPKDSDKSETPLPVEAAPTVPPAASAPFTLEEIEAMIRTAVMDPVADVRLAASAAILMLRGAYPIQARQGGGTMLSSIERIIFLKQVSFFEGMTIDQLKILANICEEEFFAEGTHIFQEGKPGGALYVVVSGRVAIERAGQRKGSVARLAVIEPRSYFGEMSLFDNSPHSASALAIQDTLTLRMRREPLVELVRQYPDLALILINVLSQRLREANERITQLTRSKPRELHDLYDKLD